jgi:hypothetical protein
MHWLIQWHWSIVPHVVTMVTHALTDPATKNAADDVEAVPHAGDHLDGGPEKFPLLEEEDGGGEEEEQHNMNNGKDHVAS